MSLIEKWQTFETGKQIQFQPTVNWVSASKRAFFCPPNTIILSHRPAISSHNLSTSFAKVQLNYPNLGFDGGCDTWDKK